MKENKEYKQIYKIASKKEPKKLAYYVYHMMKQYPNCLFCKNYRQGLIYLKGILIDEHNWNLFEVVECYKILKVLSKYNNNL